MNLDSKAALPGGAWNAHLFQVFNSVSFSLVVGTPMVLFFKHHGASATLLGVVLALCPLLNILQIPAAQLVERVGYKKFVLKGWATRSFFILGMAALAWVPVDLLGDRWRLGAMLALLTAFNATRGFSSCGFLPWMTKWIPADVRGRFLSRDQMATSLAGALTMLATAAYMRTGSSNQQFGVLFVVSFVAALASLHFLQRIPDVPTSDGAAGRGRVPWKELLLFGPFLKFMSYNVAMVAAFAGAGVLWVPLLRDVFKAGDDWILGMSALTGGSMAVASFGAGRAADRVGSRPLLGAAGIVFLIHFAAWTAVAAGWFPFDRTSAVFICVSAGIGFGIFNLANMRLVMATVPEMGRSHFLALFSVINNLTLAVLPVAWGWLIDRLAGWRVGWGGWEWNRFSLLYVSLIMFVALAQVLLRRLVEARALNTDEFLYELLVKTPARGLSRLLTRRLP